MFPTYWKKVIGDLMSSKLQTILVIFAISIGLFGTGSVLSAYAVLNYEVDTNIANSDNADFIIRAPSVNQSWVDTIRQIDGIQDVEMRRMIYGRISIDENWYPLILYVIEDFNNIRISKFFLEDGAFPVDGQVVFERSSTSISSMKMTSNVKIKTAIGELQNLKYIGTVFDPGMAPGWQDDINYGYINRNTAAILGEKVLFDRLHVRMNQPLTEIDQIATYAHSVREKLESDGFIINSVYVPEPGIHPHLDQMDSMLYLIQSFGLLSLLLSGILVYITISSLLKQQVREIGILKSIGGKKKDIFKLFYSYVFALSSVAMIIGIPMANWAGKLYSQFATSLLNFDITRDSLPVWVYLVEAFLGIAIPFLASTLPILKATKITVDEAINSHKISDFSFGDSKFDTSISKIQLFSRPQLLSLRNTFRRRMRLILLLTILGLGGATFTGAIIISDSWKNTIDRAHTTNKFDIKIEFAQPYSVDNVSTILDEFEGIVNYEYWDQVPATHRVSNIQDGLTFRLTGVPYNTSMIEYPLLKGRWLQKNDSNAIVINHELYYDDHTSIDVGDRLTLGINGLDVDWHVIGIIEELGAGRRGFNTPAAAYVSKDDLSSYLVIANETTNVKIKVSNAVKNNLELFSQRLENYFYKANFKLQDIQVSSVRLQILRNHLVVITTFLVFMALLTAFVGFLALVSVTSMNTIERSRELGILRAIGAKNRSIYTLFYLEGLIIGALSWILAFLLSFPISKIVGDFAGWIFIKSNLLFVYNWNIYIIWFITIEAISIIASYYPAKMAVKIPVNEVLINE